MDFSIFFTSFAGILNEMSPYILLGFIIAGILHEFVRPETMSRHLSGKGWRPVVKAALLGVPLPLCSCGVLPTAVGLHRQGASKGATTSFLIATPQTGVDSIAATYSLLGLPLAILRPIAALAGGFIGGISVGKFDRTDTGGIHAAGVDAAGVDAVSGCHDGCCTDGTSDISGKVSGKSNVSFLRRLFSAVRYGMVDMVGNVGKWLVIGLIVAALITVYVPDTFLLSLSGTPFLAMLAMIAVAVPMYICATGSIPIAMSLMMKGLNPGAAFVLLMAGPAANFASMMVLGKAIGKRATAIYLASVIVTALMFGLAVDYLLPASWFSVAGHIGEESCHHGTVWFETLCSAILLLALGYSFFVGRGHGNTHRSNENTDMIHEFKINGMSCNHCRMTVRNAIASIPGVENVDVDLSKASASVEGEFDPQAVVKAVSDAGFDVVSVS